MRYTSFDPMIDAIKNIPSFYLFLYINQGHFGVSQKKIFSTKKKKTLTSHVSMLSLHNCPSLSVFTITSL